MPSSMIFAGLVVIWLLILVPAVARHRQEVARPTTAALSGRVLERPRRRQTLEVDGMDEVDQPREVAEWADHDRTDDDTNPRSETADTDAAEPDETHDPDDPTGDSDDERRWERPAPRFRPGRGGFDPAAAELAARARYGFRQRVVVVMLIAAVATAVAALVVGPMLWALHGAIDIALVGYLIYLRRQVRMEEAIRERRAARMAGTRRKPAAEDPELDSWARRGRDAARPTDSADPGDPAETAEMDAVEDWDDEDEVDPDRIPGTGEPIGALSPRRLPPDVVDPEAERALPRLQPAPTPPLPAGTALVQADDEDPDLHELDGPTRPDYRRAAGE
ncbi:gephyrin-like molybdotransferase receptor GlpR [Pseudonocardia sp. GCM10023141]|uniref:divisome protein SepX/GlpR n=1 Tax=Pseudonocardia sp. GCM10023141 TaxID=3252653 RepID=UPI00360F7B8B